MRAAKLFSSEFGPATLSTPVSSSFRWIDLLSSSFYWASYVSSSDTWGLCRGAQFLVQPLCRAAGCRRVTEQHRRAAGPETFSETHRRRSDDVFHHYLGGAVEMLQVRPDGSSSAHGLGLDLARDDRPQSLVRGGVWQGCTLREPEGFALLGCTVSQGFEYEGYEAAASRSLCMVGRKRRSGCGC